ncbi:toprim domain-containing protein [Streptomyces cyaneofuscatus]|uniref:toprim domain-containing protein n=1 Tax=Streptomyces cyaneofuscatus TaxID=66883 RepID=UPI003CF9331B
MDVVDRAFQYADEAADGAQQALSRSSTQNEERLETVMHAAHAHWLVAERHYNRAREAHAGGQGSQLERHASELVSAAVETQRAAGVATTAHALMEVLDGLKPATERARQAELREQLRAELDRELTAVTRMDAANRDRLEGARWHAESAVPELGWWPALAADMAHAYQGRLWLDETGTARLVKENAEDRVVAGRKVDAARVAMLRAAGYLLTATASETSTPLRPSDMGREALYLVTLHPEGLHADANAAYEVRQERSRRSWMNNEERKSAARRLPPLDRYVMRAVTEKPVLLEDDQVPQISTEDAARHADLAELARKFGRWTALHRGERPDVIQAPRTAQAQRPEALAGAVGQDNVGGDVRETEEPLSDIPPASGQNGPLAGTTDATTAPGEASESARGPNTADETPPPHVPTELDAEIQGWSDDAPSALAEPPAAGSADPEGEPDLDSTPQSSPADTGTAQPDDQGAEAVTDAPAPPARGQETMASGMSTTPQAFPRLAQARRRALVDIARGNITEAGGVFMRRTSQHAVERAYSQHAVTDVLALGLAERAGQQIQITEYGTAWLVHHDLQPTDSGHQNAATPEKAVPSVGSIPPAPLSGEGVTAEGARPSGLPLSEARSTEVPIRRNADHILAEGGAEAVPNTDEGSTAEPTPTEADATSPDAGSAALVAANDSSRPQPVDRQDPLHGQGELFTAPEPVATVASTNPDANPGAALPADPAEGETPFPKITQAASHALFDIARGDITEVDGVFMKRTPTRGTLAKAPSQKAVKDLLELGLGERVGQYISLSERGIRWFAHHNIKLPAIGLRDASALDPTLLPPIDYTPLDYLPPADEQLGGPQPPVPAPLPKNWPTRTRAATDSAIQAVDAKAAAARARAAQFTARDLQGLAAGPESDNQRVWRTQHPLAQYDENAAAALERLTDPAEHAYATLAVHQLRAAIESVGRAATADYVERILGAGTDPVAMDKVWRTTAGIQSDDTYRHRVRGTVITYLMAIEEHADEIGLDGQAIGRALEDAAGWAGGIQPLTLRHQSEHAYFPDAEQVAGAARFVAEALHDYVLGVKGTLDAWSHLRTTWRAIEPRPTPFEGATTADEATMAVDALLAPNVPRPPRGPASSPGTSTGRTTAAPEATPDATTQGGVPGVPAPRSEMTPAPAERDEEPSTSGTEREVPVPESGATAGSDDRPVPAAPGPNGPPRPPAAVREESTVATNAPPSAAPAEKTASDPSAPPAAQSQSAPQTAAPYANAAAYAVAHEALMAELDQVEQWLGRTPVAAEAAASLVSTGTLGLPGLTALLDLQSALTPGAGASLAEHLSHHIRCSQLTMAKVFFGRAAHASSKEALRNLYEQARQGKFLDLAQQTQDGEMELGHFLNHRAQQVPQQPVDTESAPEETPETAEEATTMPADPDDDSQMPVFERPPEEILMSAAQAAPRLHAQAQAHLASGNPNVELLAHIHGRPVYAMVRQDSESARSLYLGLALRGEAASPRSVSIGADHLARVAPDELLAAVTGWMNANDDGERPLLDYGPSAALQTPAAPAPDQAQPAPAEAERERPVPPVAPAEPAVALTDTTTAPAPPGAETDGPQNPQGPVRPPVSAAPATTTASVPEEESAPDAKATPMAEGPPTAPDASTADRQTAPPSSTAASPSTAHTAAGSDEEQRHEQGSTQQRITPAPPVEQPVPATAAPVEQLTALARSALTDLGVTLEATGVLTAGQTVVITLETSGTTEQDRNIADNLRSALHQKIRQHPDQSLAAYRVDFQHTPQVGQGALQNTPRSPGTPVPRERLIAANKAAATLFTERLKSDPNAQLARTYLTEERQLPPEVQQEWGLGYAPSDGRAGRWDVVVRALRDQGFTDEELLQAGLATRSRRDTLIDPFRDRIMFAIHDEHGDIVGFSGRRIDRPGETEIQAKDRGGPKYFNTSSDATLFSKGDLVFGLHHPAQAQARANSSGPRVSVEGFLDVLAVARAAATVPLEQRSVVGAPMGTAFTERQLTVLRGLDTDNPRSHIVFLDADDSGRKVLLDKWDLLLQATGETTVTSAPAAKDAAKLWEEGVKADGDGVTPVLRVLEQHQPLLNAAVEAVLMKNADEGERANRAFDSAKFSPRTRAIAAEAARYIHQAVQSRALGDTGALEQAALDWAKRLDQQWSIPGHMTATAVLLGPGKHDEDYENEVYEQALDLLAADPEGYFANDSHVRSRQSAAEPAPPAATASRGTGPATARPGQWPAGTRASGPVISTSAPTQEPDPAGELMLNMVLPSPVDGTPVEHTDRTTAAYALHTAVHVRLGQHTTEIPEPDRLPQPLKLGTVYGVDLSTSGDDQTSDDPTVVVWLGPDRTDSLRMSYSRFVKMTGPELLAAVEWRAARAAGRLGAPLSQSWLNAVRSILPPQFPAQPTPSQLADLLDTMAQGPDGSGNQTRRRAEQALAAYTAGYPDLALDVLAPDDHIWVLRNDGSWTQEQTDGTEPTWEELDNRFSQEASELDSITQSAAAQPPGVPVPMPADLTVAHHNAHEALAALRPYSIGLTNTRYEKITDLVAQMDACEPALRRLHGPGGEQLMNRAKTSFVRILEGLATVASKIRLTSLSTRLERTVARLRGQEPGGLPAARVVRMDRRMQDLAHIERDLERRMAAPTTTLDERGELQEHWIINRARWRARYEQLQGQPPGADFLPDNGLIAGAPPIPNLTAAHNLLLDRLSARVNELRDTDPHTGEESNPYEPTADLFNGVAWAYQQRLVGIVPTGDDPQGPIESAQLRQAALTVTSHQNASPLTLRRTMNVTAERADRLLHRLEEQQILGPYRVDTPRTVLARPADIDTLLARSATRPGPRTPPAATAPAQTTAGPEPGRVLSEGPDTDELDEARIHTIVSKILADKQKRSETRGEPDPAEAAAPAPRVRKNLRKTAHKEAEANALAAGQSTSLAQSQS